MKYSLKDFSLTMDVDGSPITMELSIGSQEVEYSVEELAQFAMNFKTVVDTIKDAVKELAPIISAEISKSEALRAERHDVYEARQNEREKALEQFKADLKRDFATK